jgi:hypothetical protein
MGIEIVHDQGNALGIGVVHIDQVADLVRPVHGGALIGDAQMTTPRQGLKKQKQIAHPVTFVFAVIAVHVTRFGRQRFAYLPHLLFAALVHTHQGIAGIIGALVDR